MSAPIPDFLEEHSSEPQLEVAVRTPEVLVVNVRPLGEKTMEIGTAVAPVVYEAYNDSGAFKNEIDLGILMQGKGRV